MTKVFAYCRKSSDREDKQILGTDAQKRILQEYAAKNGLTVIDLFIENQTAYKTGRPLFNRMLERLEQGEAEGILTYHLTRLARNSFDGGRIIYMMDEETIQHIRTPEKTYTNTGDDKFLMQIHFAMAKKSSDDTSQFVTRDIESKLLRGEYPGMVPPGYLNINRDGHITKARDNTEKYMLLLKLNRPLKREEIDPLDGPIIQRLFSEAALGKCSLPQLRKLSYQWGLRTSKTGKMLSRHALENLLSNPYYYGVIAYNGAIYDDMYLQTKTGDSNRQIQHDPLISKELFEEVQSALSRRGKGRYRRHVFAFGGGLLRCGECNGVITAERQRGHVYYHCTQNRGPCSQSAWTREESVNEQFERLLRGLRLPQAYLEYAFDMARRAHGREAVEGDALRRKLQSQFNTCQQRLDALLQMKLSPRNGDGILLSDEEYLRQKQIIKEEFDLVQKQLRAVQQQGLNWIEDCEGFFRFTQHLAAQFTDATLEEKKSLLLLVCCSLTLRDQRVAGVFREPYASLAGFPLAGRDDGTPSERRKVIREAKKPEIMEKWLAILTLIRTAGGNWRLKAA